MAEDNSMKQKSSRIPLGLQAVFLASNRGNVVHQPPPDKSASKVFFGNWLFQRRGTGKQKQKVSQQEIALPAKCLPDSVTVHSPSTLSKESVTTSKEHTITPKEYVITPKEYTINVKMRRQDSRISCLSASNHSLRSTKSIRSFDSTASGTSSDKETNWLSPQGYLDVFLRSRGLSTEHFKALQTGYSNQPTPLQISSYDPFLVERVKHGDFQAVEKMLQAGISPNPCSSAGDSLIHFLCRRGDSKMLKLFLDYGASIQISDSLGRTPLHEVCWAVPCFDTIELILMADVNLINMVDGLGAAPLSYVRKDHWRQWIAFLKAKKNVLWPTGVTQQTCPPLTRLKPIHVHFWIRLALCLHSKQLWWLLDEPPQKMLELSPEVDVLHLRTTMEIPMNPVARNRTMTSKVLVPTMKRRALPRTTRTVMILVAQPILLT
ncbi:hypothetical protein FisN_3Lh081 [Fistulifera solaris]|uniref:Uncharacterized protein n=1 Tax=Fistulifera solaris TaxID=1519565 RepID=A0A1Z5JYZ3_FISSO|nr:hypothetical protein FisN_3Lh081 [Fistulifera solaris]|eukprot:GAX19139.1 hypothetical protein FisN_3Lh081 [Fistulifera solaris]